MQRAARYYADIVIHRLGGPRRMQSRQNRRYGIRASGWSVSLAPLIGVISLGVVGLSTYGLHENSATGLFNRLTTAARDCSDFATQGAAQAFYQSQGPGDPNRLDRDGDGRACEVNARFGR